MNEVRGAALKLRHAEQHSSCKQQTEQLASNTGHSNPLLNRFCNKTWSTADYAKRTRQNKQHSSCHGLANNRAASKDLSDSRATRRHSNLDLETTGYLREQNPSQPDHAKAE